MGTELAYLSNPFTLDFTAHIVDRRTLPDGRTGLVLERTFFYPTGGGQEHDTGTIGPAMVLDVVNENGDVVHVVDRDVGENQIEARVDRTRRFAFMEHHSAQHLLTQAFEQTANLDTVAVKISIDSPSTLDLRAPQVGQEQILQAEDLANAIIRQDREVKSYWITDEQVPAIPFRRPPKVTGNIRVIEIDLFDYSACGGTHVTRTGMLGVITILRAERRGDKTRIYFLAGERAFKYLRSCHTIIAQLAHRYDTNLEGVLDAAERQQESLRVIQKEREDWKAEKMTAEIRELSQSAQPFLNLRFVLAEFMDRPAQELRALASGLQSEPGLVAVLASFDGAKLNLAAACGPDVALSANELIRKQLAEIGGRGGGDAHLAQGGGTADVKRWKEILAHTRDYIRELDARTGS